MGYYTDFEFKFRLKKDTPQNIIDFLNSKEEYYSDKPAIYAVKPEPEIPLKYGLDHVFFQTPRWSNIIYDKATLKKGNNKSTSIYTYHVKGWMKAYDDVIEKFLDWVSPYVKNHKKKNNLFLGYSKGEDVGKVYYFLDKENNISYKKKESEPLYKEYWNLFKKKEGN